MADIKQINFAGGNLIFVDHTIIADAHPAFHPAGQPVMRERAKPGSHIINFILDDLPEMGRQLVEFSAKSGRPDLKRRRHNLISAAGCENLPIESPHAPDQVRLLLRL
jgi:hypothetical protein